MRAAAARLSSLVAGDVRQVVLEARRARRPPQAFTLHGVSLSLGRWATSEIRRQVYGGLYEEPERTVVSATLRADDVVLELGSGSGYITTTAARIAPKVRSFDANPELAEVARATVRANGCSATVENAVLQRAPALPSVPFYLAAEFPDSSLLPIEGAAVIDVSVRDFLAELEGCTYLIVDIEGAEADLLGGELPGIRAICVECHPALVGPAAITQMLSSLFAQGFELDLGASRGQVLFLERPGMAV